MAAGIVAKSNKLSVSAKLFHNMCAYLFYLRYVTVACHSLIWWVQTSKPFNYWWCTTGGSYNNSM